MKVRSSRRKRPYPKRLLEIKEKQTQRLGEHNQEVITIDLQTNAKRYEAKRIERKIAVATTLYGVNLDFALRKFLLNLDDEEFLRRFNLI